MIGRLWDEAAAFVLALQFLTRLPTGADRLYTPRRMAASVRYFPLVGALVGAIIAAGFLAADALLPTPLAVLLAVALGLLVTGALHEDGLADSFDGLGGGWTREATLEIMRDSRLGTYGAAALLLALALKTGALIAAPAALIPMALVLGQGLSRLSSVLAIATSAYVRDHGTGKPVAAGVSAGGLAVAIGVGAALLGLGALFLSAAQLAAGLAGLALGHGLMRLAYERRLGGYTGDTLGAVQQTSEIGFYLGLLAASPAA